MTIAVLPQHAQPLLEGRLPDWIDVRWWDSVEELHRHAPEAEIGWFDMHVKPPAFRAIELATQLRWLNSSYAGVDWMPLADLQRRGVSLTCGTGLTTQQVAEFAVMTMLAVAKDYPAVVRAQDRADWLAVPPGIRDLAGSRALLLGNGAIGRAIGRVLEAFEVETVPVTSRQGDWREQLGIFDWIVLAVPGTRETRGMIGAAELDVMKPDAVLVNFARADCVDQAALVDALREKRIAAAILDLTDPEPLPPGHPLWSLDNAHITMHLSGIPTPASQARAAERFLRNCERFGKGEPLEARVDLTRGY
ncbi:D-2-hydroxyacid dehydrogenase [Croceibacterium sp. LX-88]|uniref:D-2-hydroxyacid dehydrogenase n=1 Tax=Croceibacterium selenioxidans TaxID=2838833 RepID=A0ABS5W424_9SPHN|nr:D-2-hydroxyacid dehydrogenase [Croceibacterium selenioxidans]